MFMEDEKGLDSKVVLSRVDAVGRPLDQLTAAIQKEIGDYFNRYKSQGRGTWSKVPGGNRGTGPRVRHHDPRLLPAVRHSDRSVFDRSGAVRRNTVLRVRIVVLLTAALCAAAAAAPAGAQSVDVSADAPAAPIAPEVITRDNDGRATIRAVRVSQPLRIDGALDEILYRDVRRSRTSSRSSRTAARPPPNAPRPGSPSTTTTSTCRSRCGTAGWIP